MAIEVGVLTAVIAVVVATATFFIGRQSAAKNDGSEWGALKSDISHIMNDVQEIKLDVKDTRADYMRDISELRREFRQSTRRVHKRIDDHEEKYHGKIITRDEDREV